MKSMNTTLGRLGAVLLAFCGVVALLIWVVAAYLRSSVPTVDYTATPGPVNLTLQTFGAIGSGPHPTWVSYLAKDPKGEWVQSTFWRMPAGRTVNVTLYQYDSGGALRNAIWGGVTGVAGDAATVNGKTKRVFDPTAGNGIAHTFNVPSLGLNVPLYGVPATSKNLCSAAPCATTDAHNVIKFSFKLPAHAAVLRWQCYVPCGLSYLYGNGGPMGTVGYMGGFFKVVNV